MSNTSRPLHRLGPDVVRFIGLLLIIAAATALMLAVRLLIVEPESIARICLTEKSGWRCAIRGIAVFGFLNNVFGWSALLAGVLASVSRWRWLALFAMLAGIGGAVLYTFELSGAGILLGALTWVQRAPLPDSAHAREQQA